MYRFRGNLTYMASRNATPKVGQFDAESHGQCVVSTTSSSILCTSTGPDKGGKPSCVCVILKQKRELKLFIICSLYRRSLLSRNVYSGRYWSRDHNSTCEDSERWQSQVEVVWGTGYRLLLFASNRCKSWDMPRSQEEGPRGGLKESSKAESEI